MDKHGVGIAILSLSVSAYWFGDPQAAARTARRVNEYTADLVRSHPGRFGMFAIIPLPNTEASLREIEYAYSVLKADGIGLATSYGDKWLGHPDYQPVFGCLRVANPSAYAYVDNLRPTASAFPATISVRTQGGPASGPADPSPAFVPFADAKNCTGYDIWPYGLKARPGYSSTLTDECPAMTQGPTRVGRGIAFHKYVNEHLHAHHSVVIVPFCSHSQRCMFTSDTVLPLMFPN